MTKRKKAAHHRNAARELMYAVDYTPNGDLVCSVLHTQDPYVPYLYRGKPTRCFACRRFIEPGDTFFTCTGCTSNFHQLCYGCGIGWETFCQRLTYDQAAAIPAYGGPV